MQCELKERKVTVIKEACTPVCSCGREMMVVPDSGWRCTICGIRYWGPDNPDDWGID